MSDPSAPRLIRRFSEVIAMIDRGKLEQSANEAIREALETLGNQPGEKGKATITVSLEFIYEKGLVNIKPKLTAKLPDGDVFSPLVLWEHEGALSAQHPSQIDMFVQPRPAGVSGSDLTKAVAGE